MLLARAVISLSTISSRSWLFTSIRRTASTERSRSLPFSPNQHADELREWLRDTGAMDAEWPVKIRAEPLHRKSVTRGDAKIVHFQRHGEQSFWFIVAYTCMNFPPPVTGMYVYIYVKYQYIVVGFSNSNASSPLSFN